MGVGWFADAKNVGGYAGETQRRQNRGGGGGGGGGLGGWGEEELT